MPAFRILFSAAGAALITGSLFLLMYQLISLAGDRTGRLDPIAAIHFGPVDLAEDVATRNRRKPPEPSPPKQPPSPPRMQIEQHRQPQRVLPSAELPRLQPPLVGGDELFAGTLATVDLAAEGDIIPVLRIAPVYPRKAALAGTEGWVKVEFTITETGAVKDPKVVEAQPPRVFNREAIRAILKWKFKPRVVGGVAVERRATQVIDFTLDEP